VTADGASAFDGFPLTPGTPGSRSAAGMAGSFLEEFKRYVAFGEADEASLRALHDLARPSFPAIADAFYARILGHSEARRAITGGEAQVERLKATLGRWLGEVLGGPWDEAWFASHCRIGRIHVQIDLPQHYMFAAMNVVREALARIASGAPGLDPARRDRMLEALHKVLDLDLAVMLHTYRQDLVARAARSERLATFGQLVGTIGHELRNPLAVMETSVFLLRNRAGEDEVVRKHVDRLSAQLRLAGGIIEDLLEIIRDRPLERAAVRLGAVVLDAAAAVQRPAEVRMLSDGLEGLPDVEGDPGQLRQLFVNLVENAVQAVSPSGEVALAARADEGFLTVSVEDSGPGVDESIRGRLFEPLVTTKRTGIGLGLALVKRIAERHGGSVSYEARPGGGARFSVRLPRPPGVRPGGGHP